MSRFNSKHSTKMIHVHHSNEPQNRSSSGSREIRRCITMPCTNITLLRGPHDAGHRSWLYEMRRLAKSRGDKEEEEEKKEKTKAKQ